MHAAHADDDEADSDGAKCCSCWWYADSDAGELMLRVDDSDADSDGTADSDADEQISWLVDEM